MRLLASALTASLLLLSPGRAFPATGDDVYSRPGLIALASDGARLNLVCMGSGSPAVVFDSGWEDWAPAWAVVQPRVAKFTRACSYDRAGAGFSSAGPFPRTSVRIADELHSALRNAHIKGPYILVGNAFGGDPARTFADRYTADTAGLVLVDADASDLEPAAMRADDDRGDARYVSKLRTCRDAVAARKPLPLLPARPGQPARTCAQQFFRGIPDSDWSPALNAKLLRIAQTKVAMYDAYISEMQQMPWDEVWLKQHVRSLGSRPVRVLTSGNHAVAHLPARNARDPKHIEYERQITLAQARWLTLSSNAKQIFPANSSEYIGFDAPNSVVDAIREVYEQSATAFQDCTACPEMVVIPGGSFMMGSPAQEKAWAAAHGGSLGSVADEAPQHRVTLPSFAMGKYPVTRGEYATFVRATGYATGAECAPDSFKWKMQSGVTWQNPGFAQTDRDPVVCVSWNDAQAYVAWLNQKVGSGAHYVSGPYRLPSEAEWEFATRAGTTTAFWWGDDSAAAASHAWYKENANGTTHPVGLMPGNAFGLYDMVGDVWQWTADCYASSYAGAPVNGLPNITGSDCLRVDRGSSWLYPAWLLRSATRERNPAGFRDVIMGFRVARGLQE